MIQYRVQVDTSELTQITFVLMQMSAVIQDGSEKCMEEGSTVLVQDRYSQVGSQAQGGSTLHCNLHIQRQPRNASSRENKVGISLN